jgi:protein TonB
MPTSPAGPADPPHAQLQPGRPADASGGAARWTGRPSGGEPGPWPALDGTWEEEPGDWLPRVAVRLALFGLVGLAAWWVVLQLHKPVLNVRHQTQQVTILHEQAPPPQPEPQIEELPAARTAPDVAFETPASRPPPAPAPAAPLEELAPTEAPAPPSPGPVASADPGPAIAREDSARGELAAGAPGPGAGLASGTGTGGGTGSGGSNPARWDAAHLGNVKPAYPHLARARGHEGTALILVLVSARGLPVEVRLKQSSGSNLLDRSALEAVQGWRFVPAQENGKPVAAWLVIPVMFSLQG